MDTLSEVLKVVAVKGALFYNAEFSAPWSFRSPASYLIAPYLGPPSGHVMIYHLVAEGVAWIQVQRGLPVSLCPGDIVIFPHGDPHMMGNGPPTKPVDNGEQLQQIMSQGFSARSHRLRRRGYEVHLRLYDL